MTGKFPRSAEQAWSVLMSDEFMARHVPEWNVEQAFKVGWVNGAEAAQQMGREMQELKARYEEERR